jgi:DNA-binding CsgD family transcriptional regulator
MFAGNFRAANSFEKSGSAQVATEVTTIHPGKKPYLGEL